MSETHHRRRRRHQATPHPVQHDESAAPHHYGLRAQAAPTIDIDIAPDQVDDLQRELSTFPDLRAIMATATVPDGVDGKYGPNTFKAIAQIAHEAGISEADIPRINFRAKSGELYDKWHASLQNHHHEAETPQQVVARVEAAPQVDQAAAEAARLRAEAEARRVAEEARIPAAVRGTQYDPRHLSQVSTEELINIAKDGLHGIGEISRGFLGMGSYHRNGRLGDVTTAKILEQAHKLGIVPRDQDTLTRRELEATVSALGVEVVRRTGFTLAPLAMTERPEAAAAPVNNPAMAAALEQAGPVRNGLARVTGGQGVVATVAANVPANLPPLGELPARS